MAKKSKLDLEEISYRDNYVKNRSVILEEFAEYLKEIQEVKINVNDIINGNFRNETFCLAAIFREIRIQEKYIKSTNIPYIDSKEEKVILKQMIKDAKSVLKKNYQLLYDYYSREPIDLL